VIEPLKSPERIAAMFDAIAARYDLLNHLLSAGIDRRWRRLAIAALHLTGSERVLDLCTGTGDLAIAARAGRPPARRVVGVDFAGAMLGEGAKKRRVQRDDAIALVRGDATRIPVADAAIDAVTVGFGIRNVAAPSTACAEIHRVLRPGGRLAVLEFAIPSAPIVRATYLAYFNHVLPRIGRAVSRHHGAYGYLPASVGSFATPDEFAAVLRTAGFARVRAEPLTLGIVVLYTAVKPDRFHHEAPSRQ
jgi:demethylmenaquinone methyltransferase/2-methoxy-6-polyprenyl-1,4-benzoquinol methylase